MKPRSSILRTAPFIFILLTLLLLDGSGFAQEPTELHSLKNQYQSVDLSTHEAERVKYILQLVELLKTTGKRSHQMERAADYKAVEAEINRHPYPANADSQKLTKLLVGQWEGSRHSTEFRLNGTFEMIDGEPHGKWHIKGNELLKTYEGDSMPDAYRDTIILITDKLLILGDGDRVYLSNRIHQ